MNFKLAGKIALITGAGSGIGQATALLFASQEAKIVVNDKVKEAGEKTAKAIIDSGGEAYFALGDVSVASEASSVVNQAIDHFSKIDILFNNAGGMVGVRGSLSDSSEQDWDRVINNNLKSTFLMCKYTLPVMLKRGGGVVINMGSIYGLVGVPQTAAYCTAKAAIIHLTRQMALDYGPYNIRVNCLCPGPILTPAHAKHLRTMGNFEQMLAKRRAATALGRLGQPEDIAQAALYLASDAASFATGTVLNLDGGYDPRL